MTNPTSLESNASKTYFVNYNQDSTSISLGGKDGFKLFALSNVDEIEQIYHNDLDNIFMVERLFNSSLVALVSVTSPRKLKVCHYKKGSEICNYSYSNTILAVRMNRAILVVCLEESLYIHNIRDMKVMHTIRDTPPNPQGLCALTINSDSSCLLAYPGSGTSGEVQIFDASHLQSKISITAHDSPLAAIAFSPSGLRLATASEKGTVIRVFNAIDGSKLFEFRRGVKRCVEISSLAFSMCNNLLACSSNTETVHVFKLEAPKEDIKQSVEEGSSSGWMGYLSSYLPSQVTDVFNQGRAFATVHLPVSGVKSVVTITSIQGQARLLVATENGMLFIYNVDVNETGDLQLYKQYKLDEFDGPKSTPVVNEAHVDGESDKMREMAAAAESPPYLFNNEDDYPPLNQRPE